MSPEHWWVWLILAAVFAVGEIFSAAFFLLWFGVGAAVAGLVAWLGLGLGWQLLVFVVVSLLLLVVSRRFAERVSKPQPPGIGADRFIGKTAVVLETIDNARNTGRIRLDREEWRAESSSGNPIAEGTSVTVTAVSGTHMIVEPAKE